MLVGIANSIKEINYETFMGTTDASTNFYLL